MLIFNTITKPIFKNPFLFHLNFYTFYIEDIKSYTLAELYNIFNDIGDVINIHIIDKTDYNKKYAIVTLNKLKETSFARQFKENIEKSAYYKKGYKYYINDSIYYLTLYKNKHHIDYKTLSYYNEQELQQLKDKYTANYSKLIKFKRANISPSPIDNNNNCKTYIYKNIYPEINILSPCLDNLSEGDLSDTEEYLLI